MSSAPPLKPLPIDQQPPKKSGCSPMGMLLLGCVGVMLVCVLFCGGLGVVGYKWGIGQIDEFAKKFEQKGYVRQGGQSIQVRQSPTTNTVYVCQSLKVESDIDVDVAIMCQVAEINANIHGDVEFYGQIMNVAKGVTIDGDLHIQGAQIVDIEGEVKGKITGSYQKLTYGGKAYLDSKSPTDDEDGKAEQEPPAAPSAPAAPEAPPPPAVPPPAEAPTPAVTSPM